MKIDDMRVLCAEALLTPRLAQNCECYKSHKAVNDEDD